MNSNESREAYFKETALRLRQEGFTVEQTKDGHLAVTLEDEPLCWVESVGEITYRRNNISTSEREAAKDRAYETVRMTAEYMRQLEQAPLLKAQGLADSFKLLADFNGTVLAAQESKHGVQFVTWDWSFDRTGLNHGHYYSGNYPGAKQDFAVRAGLLEKNRLFSDEQLAEIYRCVYETLDSHYPMTVERERMLKAVAEQIEYGVQDLDALVERSNLKEMEVEGSAAYSDMTQQFS